MPRTLEQIDTALAAVETQLPRVQNGLNTTLQQTTLVIESEISEINQRRGRGGSRSISGDRIVWGYRQPEHPAGRFAGEGGGPRGDGRRVG